ncbi:hypothetical protein [Massilia endophytica]|uniref:hypothetical protein n=1 Tax=Massilia endophytica TaxID=2899220 RepID=UPI001E2F6CE8|nr:hypothetical protein [Massilia endophytica]UGQ44784.1 hypothetical protein LSQ66_13340 [Massilia endophytica]
MTRLLFSHPSSGPAASEDAAVPPPRRPIDDDSEAFTLPRDDGDGGDIGAEAEPAQPRMLAALLDPLLLNLEKAGLPDEEEAIAEPAPGEFAGESLQEFAMEGELLAELPGGTAEALNIDTDPEQATKKHAGEGWYWAVVPRSGEPAYSAALRHRSRARSRTRKRPRPD